MEELKKVHAGEKGSLEKEK
ncbi:hypothetical protein A2U01_0010552, partial [Trifolium medium]|nr:hypothetical protein [Trifolium medium]